MKSIKALVFDSNTTKKIEKLLLNHSEIEILRTKINMHNILWLLTVNKPDIVFMEDHQFNNKNQIIIDELIASSQNFPKLVLIHNKKWIERFDNEEITTIEKPLTHKKIDQIIKQFHIDRTRDEMILNVKKCPFSSGYSEKMIIPTHTGLRNIIINEILFIKKEKSRKLFFYFDTDKKELIPWNATINDISRKLAGNSFYRIDRNKIINLSYLFEIETKTRLCRLIKNGNAIVLPISKGRLKIFKEIYSSGLTKNK